MAFTKQEFSAKRKEWELDSIAKFVWALERLESNGYRSFPKVDQDISEYWIQIDLHKGSMILSEYIACSSLDAMKDGIKFFLENTDFDPVGRAMGKAVTFYSLKELDEVFRYHLQRRI